MGVQTAHAHALQGVQQSVRADKLHRFYRRNIERIAQGIAQAQRPIIGAAVIVVAVQALTDGLGQRYVLK